MMLDPADPWLEKVTDADVVDPLSKVARDERTLLLFANLLLFCVVYIGLIPTKISVLGIESGQLKAENIILLAWIIFAYYFFSFSVLVGSEYKAWSSKLNSLRERRQLRSEFYLQKYLERAPKNLDIPEDGDEAQKRELETVRGTIIALHNLTSQNDWQRYVRMYRLRMTLDGVMPIALSICNAIFASLKLII